MIQKSAIWIRAYAQRNSDWLQAFQATPYPMEPMCQSAQNGTTSICGDGWLKLWSVMYIKATNCTSKVNCATDRIQTRKALHAERPRFGHQTWKC